MIRLSAAAFVTLGFLCLARASLQAGGDFTITVTGGEVTDGAILSSTVRVEAESSFGGLNFGVYHDPAILELLGVSPSGFTEAEFDATVPEFQEITLGVDRYSYNLILGANFPVGLGPLEENWVVAEYLGSAAEGVTSLELASSNDATSPPVVTLLSGTQLEPETNDALVFTNTTLEEQFFFGVDAAPRFTQDTDFSVALFLNTALPLEAWSFGFEATSLDSPPLDIGASFPLEMVVQGSDVQALNGGDGPDFLDFQVFPTGFTMEAIVSLSGVATLPADTEQVIDLATFFANFPLELSATIVLGFTNSFGPAVSIDPLDFDPFGPGFDELVPTSSNPSFNRGDCNDDLSYNIADAVFELGFLFTMGASPNCDQACDANSDGAINISDPVFTLNSLFSGGPPPQGNGMCASGFGSSSSSLGCDGTMGCP